MVISETTLVTTLAFLDWCIQGYHTQMSSQLKNPIALQNIRGVHPRIPLWVMWGSGQAYQWLISVTESVVENVTSSLLQQYVAREGEVGNSILSIQLPSSMRCPTNTSSGHGHCKGQ